MATTIYLFTLLAAAAATATAVHASEHSAAPTLNVLLSERVRSTMNRVLLCAQTYVQSGDADVRVLVEPRASEQRAVERELGACDDKARVSVVRSTLNATQHAVRRGEAFALWNVHARYAPERLAHQHEALVRARADAAFDAKRCKTLVSVLGAARDTALIESDAHEPVPVHAVLQALASTLDAPVPHAADDKHAVLIQQLPHGACVVRSSRAVHDELVRADAPAVARRTGRSTQTLLKQRHQQQQQQRALQPRQTLLDIVCALFPFLPICNGGGDSELQEVGVSAAAFYYSDCQQPPADNHLIVGEGQEVVVDTDAGTISGATPVSGDFAAAHDATRNLFSFTTITVMRGGRLFGERDRTAPLRLCGFHAFTIGGDVSVSGQSGRNGGSSNTNQAGAGGLGGAAASLGGQGGRGGEQSNGFQGQPGQGLGAGGGATKLVATNSNEAAGGGGGHQTAGQAGNAESGTTGGSAGGTYNTAPPAQLVGGSGGGGGTGRDEGSDDDGGGGGGGAGAMELLSGGPIVIMDGGDVTARGGQGGFGGTFDGGNGGSGSGGIIVFSTPVGVVNDGNVDVRGGSPQTLGPDGGRGGNGGTNVV